MSTANAEIRTDILTGRRVIVAEVRAERPVRTKNAVHADGPTDDPFLEGAESETPDEQIALRGDDSLPNAAGWLIRVVPNRYPVVSAGSVTADDRRVPSVVPPAEQACGTHDVVIECPDFRTRLVEFTVVEFARVLRSWQLRIDQLQQTQAVYGEGTLQIVVFRNEGRDAGASLPHAHSQILAFARPVGGTEALLNPQESRSDLYAEWLSGELREATRVVRQTEKLAVLCPYAGRVAWQTRFCPLPTSEMQFAKVTESDLLRLSEQVLSGLLTLESFLGPIHHNLTLTLSPPGDPFWILDLLPRTSGLAGFELLTGVDIVSVSPETSACRLRESASFVESPAANDILCPDGYSWRF